MTTNNSTNNYGGGGGQVSPMPVMATDEFVNPIMVSYNNGVSGVGATITNAGTQAAFALDGYTGNPGDRFLFTQLTDSSSNPQYAWNGVYELSNTGSGSTNFVLTRTTDFDTASQMYWGVTVWVDPLWGSVYGANSISYLSAAVVNIGTDNIFFEPGGSYAVPLSSSASPGRYVFTNLGTGFANWQAIPPSGSEIIPIEATPTSPQYAPRYYATIPNDGFIDAALDTTLATGTIYFVPLPVVFQDVDTIVNIGLDLPTPLGSGNICFFVYASGGFGSYPDNGPLYSSGSIPLTSNPVTFNTSASWALPGAGIYWLAYTIDSGSPHFYCNNSLSGNGDQIIVYNQSITTTGIVPSVTGFNFAFSYSTTGPTAGSNMVETLQSNTAGNLLVWITYN